MGGKKKKITLTPLIIHRNTVHTHVEINSLYSFHTL